MNELKRYLNTNAEQKARRMHEEKLAAERRDAEKQAKRFQEVTAEAQKKASERRAAKEQAERYREVTAEAQKKAAERKAAKERAKRYQAVTAETRKKTADTAKKATVSGRKKRKLNAFGVRWTIIVGILSLMLPTLEWISEDISIGAVIPILILGLLYAVCRCYLPKIGGVFEAILIPLFLASLLDFLGVKSGFQTEQIVVLLLFAAGPVVAVWSYKKSYDI